MTSTTYVQFLKGGLLIVFSLVVTIALLVRGLSTKPDQGGKVPFHAYAELVATTVEGKMVPADAAYTMVEAKVVKDHTFVKLSNGGKTSWWMQAEKDGKTFLKECQWEAQLPGQPKVMNGEPGAKLRQVGTLVAINGDASPEAKTGSVGPFGFLAKIGAKDTKVQQWKISPKFKDASGAEVSVHYPYTTTGNKILRPGAKFKLEGTWLERLDFISLMLALFLGTAALPHILIRYYTVASPAAARKSTIVAIAAIGFFYLLTLYMGLGAMVNGVINPLDNNMSAPLLAKSFGTFLFAVISAIAFATVLGTVAGLIVAASGAVAHDLMDRFMNIKMDENQKVKAGRIAALAVGVVAILLGIIFKGQNVSFLVGLAFAVAASANLPAIVMLLFWKRTTAKGIAASIGVGVLSSLTLIAFSPNIYKQFGLDPARAPIPFDNPGIVSIPLSFLVLVVVSLLTEKKPDLAEL
jgi:cation/acetate symporter